MIEDEKHIVHQVRAVSPKGRIRIVHAYESAEEAREAVRTMKAKTNLHYVIVEVPNDPAQHWGVNK